MDNSIMEPLKFYETEAKDQHKQSANTYFDRLVAESGIDVEENRTTVKKYREQMEAINAVQKERNKYNLYRIGLFALAIFGFIMALVGLFGDIHLALRIIFPLLFLPGGIYAIYYAVKKINPKIRELDEKKELESSLAQDYLDQAKAQMEPLNALFDDDDAKKLVEDTLPQLKFEKNFSVKTADLFRRLYSFVDIDDEDYSAVDLLSGTMFDNPFLFQRFLRHTMGTHVYHGSLVIHWTETYRDSEGNLRTRQRTQTLHASVEKPKPYYTKHTLLGYGNQGAPNLNFSRQGQHHERKSEKQLENHVKKNEKKIQKMARDAMSNGGSFTELSNSQFDVLFDALDRDNEVEFRLLFTPLAQTNMVKLMRSHTGYGDDFNFTKQGMYSVISSEHAQKWDMNTSAEKYYSYDIDDARSKFVFLNEEFFKNLYFDFAPLLAIPVYQQGPAPSMEPYDEPAQYFTYYEHEALANALGDSVFAHPESATEAILKTEFLGKTNGGDAVAVTAFSYAAEERVDFIPVLGGDGRWHNVPVPWIEYIPIERTRPMVVRELGYSEKTFRQKKLSSLAEPLEVLNGRNAYMHGLFAYALEEEESWDFADSYFTSL